MNKEVAFLWDESFLWGLMAYKSLQASGLYFELIRSEDIRNGRLEGYSTIFVPGGWASNKIKTLGDEGAASIRKFIENGGNYVGICGGAGLATTDGIGLLSITRKPTKERVPSFSGRVRLSLNERTERLQLLRYQEHDKHEEKKERNEYKEHSYRGGHDIWMGVDDPVFYAWWPSQFIIRDDTTIDVIARYERALPDAFSSDLCVFDIPDTETWRRMEADYGINLDPERMYGDPAVVEGSYGKGRVILSLVHFDTPGDVNGSNALKNIWRYLGVGLKDWKEKKSDDVERREKPEPAAYEKYGDRAEYLDILESIDEIARSIIDLGIRNFLWFWRNPMLLQWRRGIRGLEFCTIYVMAREIVYAAEHSLTPSMAVSMNDLNEVLNEMQIFCDKASHLLIMERQVIQSPRKSSITYKDCDDPEIIALRLELFGSEKSHGGLFKQLVDSLDGILYQHFKNISR